MLHELHVIFEHHVYLIERINKFIYLYIVNRLRRQKKAEFIKLFIKYILRD